MTNGFHRALAHLSEALLRHTEKAASGTGFQKRSVGESTPNWHGDHWQNLLSCPMDARRYILEDWTETFDAFAEGNDDGRIDSFSGRQIRRYN